MPHSSNLFFPLVLIFLVVSLNSFSSSGNSDSTICFFPHSRIFPSIFLDPLECQISGSTNFLSKKGNELSLYNLVNFGFTKPVFSKQTETFSWEINFGAATFTQFDLLKKSNGRYLAGLLNNDYKLSADFSLQKSQNVFRFRLFHVSSHLGDDYMLRHQDTIPNDKSNNYEQSDFTYLRLNGRDYWYAGAGAIYTPYAFRKRFSLFGGGLWNFGKSEKLNFFGSFNLKLLQENNFSPDFRDAYGINILRNKATLLRLWIEFYSGHLPYSTLKYGRISWIGAGMAINLY